MLSTRRIALLLAALFASVALPGVAHAQTTGGTSYQADKPAPKMSSPGRWSGATAPGSEAKLLKDGTAAAPASAPDQVKQAIWAANSMQKLPYLYGGGHNLDFDVSKGADCSGTVSFALKAGELIKTPLDSGRLMKWGEAGVGKWITVYSHPNHAFVVIAGLRLDTSVGRTSRGPARHSLHAPERTPLARPDARHQRVRQASSGRPLNRPCAQDRISGYASWT